mmetsp:Transcript_4290/g.10911  ORF Transcript_4290/g.10911 Transcript_4290/m.10911 type:complete len:125 (+) Transcript_4290:464-838(+)
MLLLNYWFSGKGRCFSIPRSPHIAVTQNRQMRLFGLQMLEDTLVWRNTFHAEDKIRYGISGLRGGIASTFAGSIRGITVSGRISLSWRLKDIGHLCNKYALYTKLIENTKQQFVSPNIMRNERR